MADVRSLDQYHERYVPLQAVSLRENPSLAEVIGPLYSMSEDDPDGAA
jgi:hypothetical protein